MLLDDIRWMVTRVDGRIAAVSPDWRGLQRTVRQLDGLCGRYPASHKLRLAEVTTSILDMDGLRELGRSVTLDDLLLLGTPFQQEVWRELFTLTHPEHQAPGLFSYTDFAMRCGKKSALRAVAHAVGLNPINYILPCHLVVPMDTLRRIEAAYEAAIDTIFQGRDLYVFGAFDMGDYSLGRALKRELIAYDLQ